MHIALFVINSQYCVLRKIIHKNIIKEYKLIANLFNGVAGTFTLFPESTLSQMLLLILDPELEVQIGAAAKDASATTFCIANNKTELKPTIPNLLPGTAFKVGVIITN